MQRLNAGDPEGAGRRQCPAGAHHDRGVRMNWTVRSGVTRAVLWCALFATCPAVAVAAAVRPAAAFVAALCGTPFVWVSGVLLARDRPPWHRCPPRHARHGYAGTDTDTKLRVADIERELRGYGKFFTALGLRPEPRPRKWRPEVIKGGDDQEGDPGTKAGLTCAALTLVG